MLNLTRQEKTALLFISFVLLAGTTIKFLFYKYSSLYELTSVIKKDGLYHKIDINTASLEELVAIPYIGDYTAQKILEYRQKYGRVQSLKELKSIKGIKDKNFEKFCKYLKADLKE